MAHIFNLTLLTVKLKDTESMFYPDGSYYTGEFKNGAFNGKGKFFYKLNKMTYEG